ncbi:NF038129 family PEP-CTERM protein [Duganella sp. CT11-25]|uniref:NF038129 family PEP-CTERM protein n=1 Tax=unclassified Duganella TaxID=2636909 RepID=UPI0039AEC2BB
MFRLNTLMARLMAVLVLACGTAQAAPQVYHVDIDTTVLSGQDGYLDFLFLGLGNAAPVQARLSNFSGDFTAQSFALGQAGGTVDTLLSIGNGATWNEFGQWAHLGGALSFDVRFDYAAATGAGTTLSIALLDAGLNYLGTAGDVATFALLPGSGAAVSVNGAYASVTAVPEPAAFLMFAAGLLLIVARLSPGRSAPPRSGCRS